MSSLINSLLVCCQDQKLLRIDRFQIDFDSNFNSRPDFDPLHVFPYEFKLILESSESNVTKKFIQLPKDQKHPITSDRIFTIAEHDGEASEVELEASENEVYINSNPFF